MKHDATTRCFQFVLAVLTAGALIGASPVAHAAMHRLPPVGAHPAFSLPQIRLPPAGAHPALTLPHMRSSVGNSFSLRHSALGLPTLPRVGPSGSGGRRGRGALAGTNAAGMSSGAAGLATAARATRNPATTATTNLATTSAPVPATTSGSSATRSSGLTSRSSLVRPLPNTPAGLLAPRFNPENGIIAGSNSTGPTGSAASCRNLSFAQRLQCEETQQTQ